MVHVYPGMEPLPWVTMDHEGPGAPGRVFVGFFLSVFGWFCFLVLVLFFGWLDVFFALFKYISLLAIIYFLVSVLIFFIQKIYFGLFIYFCFQNVFCMFGLFLARK